MNKLLHSLILVASSLLLYLPAWAETFSYQPPLAPSALSLFKPTDWSHRVENNHLFVTSPEGDRWYEIWEVRGLTSLKDVQIYLDTYLKVLYQEQLEARELVHSQMDGRGAVFKGRGTTEGFSEEYQCTILQPTGTIFLVLLSRSDRELPPLSVGEILKEKAQE